VKTSICIRLIIRNTGDTGYEKHVSKNNTRYCKVTFYFAPYRVLRPMSKGIYLYLIICLDIVSEDFTLQSNFTATYCICLRMVNAKRMKKYIRRIGQYTGMSNASENVQNSATSVARVDESLCKACQRKQSSDDYRHVPEIPLRQPSNKWTEFIILL
jgi:hypothetical protein